jgi:hypothetical protein
VIGRSNALALLAFAAAVAAVNRGRSGPLGFDEERWDDDGGAPAATFGPRRPMRPVPLSRQHRRQLERKGLL